MRRIIPLIKGWSNDQKFIEEAANGKRYLLRKSSINQCKHRHHMVEAMNRCHDLGVKLCKPVSFQQSEDVVTTRFEWLEGIDFRDEKSLSTHQYVAYGHEAGRYLKLIHSLPAPPSTPSWEVRFTDKIKRKLDDFFNHSIDFNKSHILLEFIESSRHLLASRPTTFQHGDYHCGNMMLVDGILHIIDFDRFDYGDPWEEFNRIVWCVETNPHFASALIDAYFNHAIPSEFWSLLRLYISVNTLSSLVWAIGFGNEEIATMHQQAHDVLDWYKDVSNPIPSWYQSTLNFK